MAYADAWQRRTFGPAASVIKLASKGGAVLGGVWISAVGAVPTFTAYDTASAAPALRKIVSSVASLARGMHSFGPDGIGCGTGLAVRVVSMTCTVLWRPSSAGV